MDVITFGEAMVRLSPANFRRLEQATSLDIEIGGAELNTAVGLARLGRSAAWVSRLTDNPLGRLVAAPRPSAILYDRAESAMARIEPGMIDWPKVFDGSVWFYTTGITAALSPTAADATLEALRAAKAAGLITCLDPNYRAKLWTVEA